MKKFEYTALDNWVDSLPKNISSDELINVYCKNKEQVNKAFEIGLIDPNKIKINSLCASSSRQDLGLEPLKLAYKYGRDPLNKHQGGLSYRLNNESASYALGHFSDIGYIINSGSLSELKIVLQYTKSDNPAFTPIRNEAISPVILALLKRNIAFTFALIENGFELNHKSNEQLRSAVKIFIDIYTKTKNKDNAYQLNKIWQKFIDTDENISLNTLTNKLVNYKSDNEEYIKRLNELKIENFANTIKNDLGKNKKIKTPKPIINKIKTSNYTIEQLQKIRSNPTEQLFIAIHLNDKELVTKLLQIDAHKTNLNEPFQRIIFNDYIIDPRTNSPLMYAINLQNMKMIDLLLKYGASFTKPAINDYLPINAFLTKIVFPHILSTKVSKKDMDLLKRIIKLGKSEDVINALDSFGNTPLINLATHRIRCLSPEFVEEMALNGADLTIRNNKGETFLDIIKSSSYSKNEKFYERLQNNQLKNKILDNIDNSNEFKTKKSKKLI